MHTEAKVNIDGRIEKGLTNFFKDKKQAKDLADKTNTYVYEVFQDEISTDKKGREIIISSFVGYGVPK